MSASAASPTAARATSPMDLDTSTASPTAAPAPSPMDIDTSQKVLGKHKQTFCEPPDGSSCPCTGFTTSGGDYDDDVICESQDCEHEYIWHSEISPEKRQKSVEEEISAELDAQLKSNARDALLRSKSIPPESMKPGAHTKLIWPGAYPPNDRFIYESEMLTIVHGKRSKEIANEAFHFRFLKRASIVENWMKNTAFQAMISKRGQTSIFKITGTATAGKSHCLMEVVMNQKLKSTITRPRIIFYIDCDKFIKHANPAQFIRAELGQAYAQVWGELVKAYELSKDEGAWKQATPEQKFQLGTYNLLMMKNIDLATLNAWSMDIPKQWSPLFAVDQWNVFTSQRGTVTPSTVQEIYSKKQVLQTFMCSHRRIIVQSASSEDFPATSSTTASTDPLLSSIECNGGLNEHELKQWWEDCTPYFIRKGIAASDLNQDSDLRAQLGNSPLFLEVFLYVAEITPLEKFRQDGKWIESPSIILWKEMVNYPPVHKLLRAQRESIHGMVKYLQSNPLVFDHPRTIQFFASALLNQDMDGANETAQDLHCDPRFIWIEGNATIHLLNSFTCRELLQELEKADVERKCLRRIQDDVEKQKLLSKPHVRNNPSVFGFYIEWLVLDFIQKTPDAILIPAGKIVKDGEAYPDIKFTRDDLNGSISIFHANDFEDKLSASNGVQIFIPAIWNYTGIDALIRINPSIMNLKYPGTGWTKKKDGAPLDLLILPIQITLQSAKQHAASLEKFFPSCYRWLAHSAATLAPKGSVVPVPTKSCHWAFVWIVPASKFDEIQEFDTGNYWVPSDGADSKSTSLQQLVIPIEQILVKPDILGALVTRPAFRVLFPRSATATSSTTTTSTAAAAASGSGSTSITQQELNESVITLIKRLSEVERVERKLSHVTAPKLLAEVNHIVDHVGYLLQVTPQKYTSDSFSVLREQYWSISGNKYVWKEVQPVSQSSAWGPPKPALSSPSK